MSQAERITNHDQIRSWAEARGARPAQVKGVGGGGDGGILRFDFGEPEESLEEISWDRFFEIFEDRKLALLEQEETGSGETSRFFKFIER